MDEATRSRHTGPWGLASLVLAIAIWALYTIIARPAEYLLPSPWLVAEAMMDSTDALRDAGMESMKTILGGFVLAAAISIPLGVLIVSNSWIDRLIYPLVVALNSVPKVALAPLFLVWFGYGFTPRALITVSICAFPVLVDTIGGLKSVDPEVLRLARSVDAKRSRVFLRIRLRQALPNIFSGLKVASSLAVVGAVFAEMIAGDAGWGYMLVTASGQFDTALIFGILILLSLVASILFFGLAMLERVIIPWHSSMR